MVQIESFLKCHDIYWCKDLEFSGILYIFAYREWNSFKRCSCMHKTPAQKTRQIVSCTTWNINVKNRTKFRSRIVGTNSSEVSPIVSKGFNDKNILIIVVLRK